MCCAGNSQHHRIQKDPVTPREDEHSWSPGRIVFTGIEENSWEREILHRPLQNTQNPCMPPLYSRGMTSVDKTENHSHTDRSQLPRLSQDLKIALSKLLRGQRTGPGHPTPRLLRVTVTQTRRMLQSIVLASCFLDGFGIVRRRHTLAQWSHRASWWKILS